MAGDWASISARLHPQRILGLSDREGYRSKLAEVLAMAPIGFGEA